MAEEEKDEKKTGIPSSPSDTAPTSPNPLVKAAQDEAALAKAQAEKAKAEKEIVEHQRDKMKAELMPVAASDKVAAPTGDVTTDEAGFVETQILGQAATRKIAKMLAADLKDIKTLVIYNAADIQGLTAYGALLQELNEFVREFELKQVNAVEVINATENTLESPDFEPPKEAAADFLMAAIAAPAIAAGAIKSIAELINLFRTTTEIKNKTLSGTEDLVISYLVREFNEMKPSAATAVYSPALFPPRLLDSSDQTELVLALTEIRQGRFTAHSDLKKIAALAARIAAATTETQADLAATKNEIITNEAALAKLAPDDPQRPPLETALKKLREDKHTLENRLEKFAAAASDLNDIKSKVEFIVASAEQLLGGLETPDAATKQTPLSKLLVIAHLHKLLNDADTFTLRYAATANGTTKIKKNFFWNASVRHSAGATLAYQLFNREGRIVRANAFQWYFDWKTSEEINRMISPDRSET